MKVMIADDHAIVREGLKQILARDASVSSVDEAGDGFEALEMAVEHEYDVVILDLTMPGMSGLEVLKSLKQSKPNQQVLILSIHSEEQYAIRMLKAGASGYLMKDSAPNELMVAVTKVASGGKFITAKVAEKLASSLDPAMDGNPHEKLSDREFEVLKLIAEGNSVSNAAEKMHLSVKTVSTYRTRLLEKLNLKNNAELTRYAIDNRLV